MLISWNVSANHFFAGEMHYKSIGNDNYEFNLAFYRCCYTSGVNFDDPISFTIYNGTVLIGQVSVPFTSASPVINSSYHIDCYVTNQDTCFEYAVYSTIINLPPIVGGYTVSYQRFV